MATIANLQVSIGADIKRLERGLSKAQRRIQDAGRSMQRIGRSLTFAITAPLAGVGGMALKTAADFESLQQSMNILNGSVEEGTRNFERLQEFSATTPFQLSELAEAQNMLQGFGQSADDAFESMKMIGDIAAVASGDIKGIGIAFGQAAAEGRLMTRDIRQLINQGVPAIKLLADTMGVAQSEVLDLASEGEISFEILQQAFRDATSEGGMFANGMAKQAETLAGRFSTMKDNISLALGDLGDVMAGTAKRVMNGVINIAQRFRMLGDETKQNIVALGIALAALPPILFGIGTALLAITSPIAWITAGLAGLSAGILYLIDNWDAVIERLSDIGWWRNTLISMGQFVVEWGIFPSLLIKGWNKVIGYITDLQWFKDALIEMSKMATNFIPLPSIVKAQFKAGLESLKGTDLDIDVPEIPNPFEGMADGLEELKVETQDYEHQFGSFTDAIINGSKSALAWLGSFLDTTPQFRVMGDAFTDVGNTISDVMEGIKQDTKEATNAASDGAKKAATDFQLMGDAFRYVGNTVSDIMPKMTTKFFSMESKASRMASAINRGFNDMTATFAEGIGKMMAGTQNLSGVFNDVLMTLANLAVRVGKIAIAVGIGIQAIKEALKSLNPFVAIAAGATLIALGSWAKSALQSTGNEAGDGNTRNAPRLAQGGLAFGPTLAVVGDNANARSNPEVIAPLDKLQGMMNQGGGTTRVEGIIKGSDIHLANERGKNKFR